MPQTSPVKQRPNWVISLAIILVVVAYGWTFWAEHAWRLSKEADSYYGFLTDSLVSGQTSLKIAPDPRLAALANPWASYQGIPRLHDATYYHGKYYLYFGAAPVVVFFGPIRLLTGRYAGEGAAGCVFGLIGFLLGLAILRRALRAQLPSIGPWWTALGILLWGFGTHAFVVAQAAVFYSVPILCAFMCLMAAVAALGKAVEASSTRRSLLWLSAASAAWGLCVASRPHYVYSLPLILVGTWLVHGRWNALRKPPGRVRLLAASVIPAGVIGLTLAVYNDIRFGSPTEFGQHYQFAGSDVRSLTYFHPEVLLGNLRGYFLSAGQTFLHFPVFVPEPASTGVLAWMPFIGLALLAPFVWRRGDLPTQPGWRLVMFCAALPSLIHVLAMSLIPIGYARYDVDFAPGLMLAALITAGVVVPLTPRWPVGYARGFLAVVVLLAAASLIRPWALVLDATPDTAARTEALTAEERFASGIERLLHLKYGPLRADVAFDRLAPGQTSRILETDHGGDWLAAERLSSGTLRLIFTHLGDPPVVGTAFEVRPGAASRLEVDLGAFYPPDHHPLYDNWQSAAVDAVHRRVQASVDGRSVLSGNSSFYPTDPFHLRIGAGSIDGSVIGVSHLEQGPPPTENEVRRGGWRGAVSLKVVFPPFETPRSEPLLATGTYSAGELVYVTYEAKGRYRFGLDTTTGGSVESTDIELDPASPHVLEIDFGALHPTPPANDHFNLIVDGRWLVTVATQSLPNEPYQTVFGYNENKVGLSKDAFAGQILAAEPIAPLQFKGTPIPGAGPLWATFEFPKTPAALCEPLVTSGVTGKGDIVYVRYLDARHVRIGIDHWGVGAVESQPIELPPGSSHRLSVSSATFLPPLLSRDWGATPPGEQAQRLAGIRVDLDSRTVVTGPWTGYPAGADQITVGSNSIGGSDTSPTFSGKVREALRRMP